MSQLNTMEELEKVALEDKELNIIKLWINTGQKNYNYNFTNIVEIIAYCTPPSWENLFYDNVKIIRNINNVLQGKNYYPYTNKVFNCYFSCKLQDIKVVIIAQDPYQKKDFTGIPYATGLAFSIRPELPRANFPPTLKNIVKELELEYPGSFVNNGDLTKWALQGVFMLNSCLTVKPDESDSHKELWFGIIQKTLEMICKNINSCVFLLLGQKAQKLEKYLTNKAIIIKGVHPSGLSANKGFFGCNHFRKINEALITLGKQPINWF